MQRNVWRLQEPAGTSWRAAGTGLGAGAATGLLALTLGRAGVATWHAAGRQGLADVPVDHALQVLTLAAGAALSGWLTVLLWLGTVAVLPGRVAHPLRAATVRLAPRWVPRVAAGLLTVAIGWPSAASATPAPVATAATSAPVATAATSASPATSLPGAPWAGTDPEQPPEPGWRPLDPPAGRTADVDLVSRGTADADTVVVRSGDTLWDIAARHLGSDATPEHIAREWPRWHQANREVIGPEPDLILPGQQLVAPPEPAATTGDG